MKISAIILTKNEEKNIESCLKSLIWCNEIIVIDDNSSDKTVEIAKKYTTHSYARTLAGDFSAQRNFGLSKASYEWVLFVDADEEVLDKLKHEIETAILTEKYNGYLLKRKDIFLEKELRYGETASVTLLRLAKKGKGEWEGKVHEEWKIDGEIGFLQNPLIHSSHQTLAEFLQDINFYTSIRAEELFEKKIKSYWYSIILYPTAKLIQNFIIKKGYKDGTAGFVFAVCMSFHSFLVRGKLWLLWHNK